MHIQHGRARVPFDQISSPCTHPPFISFLIPLSSLVGSLQIPFYSHELSIYFRFQSGYLTTRSRSCLKTSVVFSCTPAPINLFDSKDPLPQVKFVLFELEFLTVFSVPCCFLQAQLLYVPTQSDSLNRSPENLLLVRTLLMKSWVNWLNEEYSLVIKSGLMWSIVCIRNHFGTHEATAMPSDIDLVDLTASVFIDLGLCKITKGRKGANDCRPEPRSVPGILNGLSSFQERLFDQSCTDSELRSCARTHNKLYACRGIRQPLQHERTLCLYPDSETSTRYWQLIQSSLKPIYVKFQPPLRSLAIIFAA